MSPSPMKGLSVSYRCRSEPQMLVVVIRTIASVGSEIVGSGTSSTRTSRCPCHTTAFIRSSPLSSTTVSSDVPSVRRRKRALSRVVHLLQPVHRRGDGLVASLELQRQVQRIEPRLVQVAAVEPQVLHLRRLPHVPLFALPRPWVL